MQVHILCEDGDAKCREAAAELLAEMLDLIPLYESNGTLANVTRALLRRTQLIPAPSDLPAGLAAESLVMRTVDRDRTKRADTDVSGGIDVRPDDGKVGARAGGEARGVHEGEKKSVSSAAIEEDSATSDEEAEALIPAEAHSAVRAALCDVACVAARRVSVAGPKLIRAVAEVISRLCKASPVYPLCGDSVIQQSVRGSLHALFVRASC